jgi:nitrate reductase gamma subunit
VSTTAASRPRSRPENRGPVIAWAPLMTATVLCALPLAHASFLALPSVSFQPQPVRSPHEDSVACLVVASVVMVVLITLAGFVSTRVENRSVLLPGAYIAVILIGALVTLRDHDEWSSRLR